MSHVSSVEKEKKRKGRGGRNEERICWQQSFHYEENTEKYKMRKRNYEVAQELSKKGEEKSEKRKENALVWEFSIHDGGT